MDSRFLASAELREIDRIGDILIPGDRMMPRFSECTLSAHADRMLLFLPKAEVIRLRLLLRFSRLLPCFALRLLLRATTLDRFLPLFAASRLRKLEMGLRGLVFSLYYSFLDTPSGCGCRIQEAIGWDAAVRTKPEDPDGLPGLVQRANPLDEPEVTLGDPSNAPEPTL